ncbi:MAG: alanine racemase [Alphaproteobacteria bacterium]|nr:alanine racemase [Alphaproteobacteria bacterium]HCP00991.1 alanine racemase [Rhodospirillaceae bacterium]
MVIPADAGALLIVDLDAIAENFRRIKSVCTDTCVGAAVKANAYGLGAGAVTRTLAAAGCDTFFVATICEGIQLRKTNGQAKIIVLNGPEVRSLDTMRNARLTPTLNSLAQIDILSKNGGNEPARAWLHLDTGMNRLGLNAHDVDALCADPARMDGIDVMAILSHLACADTPNHPMNELQRATFDTLRARMAPLTGAVSASLANSPGIFLGPSFHYDMVRPGAALYGVRPSAQGPNPMVQVIDIYTKILQVRDVDTPMTVGYGAIHRVGGPRRIATLAAGYADGYPRAAGETTGYMESSSMCAYINGKAAPLVGRVSMDLITIDVTDIPTEYCQPGQTVELLGPNVNADSLAEASGTIAYEVLSRLGPRLRVEYRGGAV